MKPKPTTTEISAPDRERWLYAIVPLREGAELRGVHVDTLKRDPRTKAKILRVSARRLGIRRRDALMLD